jgi:putative colanic acid biosysnthesis UDP-glucose lipid carrier transferase
MCHLVGGSLGPRAPGRVDSKKVRSNRMDEPVILKNSLAILVVATLQVIAPAAVGVGSLYVVLFACGVAPDPDYHALAVLVGLLALLLPRPPRTLQGQLLTTAIPLTVGILARWMTLLVALLVIGYVTKLSGHYSRRAILIWAVASPVVIVAFALYLHDRMRSYLLHPDNARKAVLAGYNGSSYALAERLRRNSELGFAVEGFFDDRGPERLKVNGNGEVPLLGKLADLPAYVRKHGVGVIFIALPVGHVARATELFEQLRDTTASIYYLPDMLLFDLVQARTLAIQGIPVVSMCETPLFGYRAIVKRMADVLISSALLLLTSPLMIAIAILVRLSSLGPIIFRQRRYGLNGEEILVYKFRTMTVTEDGPDIPQATKSDSRTTPVGRFLRRYSLDELPQLFNVLAGKMSLVGPRPHAVAHNEMYRKLIKGYMVRYKVKPGITGLAQVNGLRGETRTLQQMEARVRYDLEYLRNWSFELDLAILAKTVYRVFRDANAF